MTDRIDIDRAREIADAHLNCDIAGCPDPCALSNVLGTLLNELDTLRAAAERREYMAASGQTIVLVSELEAARAAVVAAERADRLYVSDIVPWLVSIQGASAGIPAANVKNRLAPLGHRLTALRQALTAHREAVS